MRIIVVSHDSFWPLKGGGGLRVYWVTKSLLDRGHTITALAPLESPQGLEECFLKLNLVNLGKLTRFTRRKELNYVKLMIKVFVALWRQDADIIYAHNFVAALPSYLVARLKGIPLVFDMDDLMTGLSSYNIIAKWGPRFELLLARKADSLIVMSKALADEVRKHRLGRRIEYIPHGVNLTLFRPLNTPKNSSILFMGGLERHDGVHLIPLAAKQVLAVLPNIKFVIVGEGRYLPLLRELVAKEGLAANFEFHSWVSHRRDPTVRGASAYGVGDSSQVSGNGYRFGHQGFGIYGDGSTAYRPRPSGYERRSRG